MPNTPSWSRAHVTTNKKAPKIGAFLLEEGPAYFKVL